MHINRDFGRLFRYLLILLVFLLDFFMNAKNTSLEQAGLIPYLMKSLGGISVTRNISPVLELLRQVPAIVVLYALSSLMQEDCLINYVYVFTRLSKKEKWLFHKAVQIVLKTAIIYAVLFAVCIGIGRAYGLGGTSSPEQLFWLFAAYALDVLTISVLSFSQNFLSLRHGVAQSFLALVLFYLLSLLAGMLAFNFSPAVNDFLMLLIPVHQMYCWHAGCAQGTASAALKGLSLTISFLFLTGYFIVFYVAARSVFKKSDLMEMVREA
jgi:hypothetical protein